VTQNQREIFAKPKKTASSTQENLQKPKVKELAPQDVDFGAPTLSVWNQLAIISYRP
jgi:hypothetical protein